MNKLFTATLFIFCAWGFSGCTRQPAPEINLRYDENQSLEYQEVIETYRELASYYDEARLMEMGPTDTGRPLHLFLISGDGDFDPASLKEKGRSIVLINNGIHAGEPAGIDSSIEYAAGLLQNKDGAAEVLENTTIAIIPVYSIGGYLDQSRYYRMNQNGPEYKGSRRNARNLDLNRDFIKQDSQNARSFAEIFHYLDPDVLIDTHTTNGMEHQAVMTLIASTHQKFPGEMGTFFKEEMQAELYRKMNEETPWGMVPYLQSPGRGDIRSGITGFSDHPYYSSGYAALFNTLAFITETQFAKPYPERVLATLDFIRFTVDYTARHTDRIRQMRKEASAQTKARESFVLDWAPDMDQYDQIVFKGYETSQSTTPLTKRTVTNYHYDQPWSDTIPFYNYFEPLLRAEAPEAYIIPQAWHEVISRMEQNGVRIDRLEKDTIMETETTYVEDYEVSGGSNQGRQTISQLETRTELINRQFYEGDAIIYTNQPANNYIVHTLEPYAPASFLGWGFFTSALEDGEGWWIFGFEDYAWEQLQEDEVLREAFEARKAENEAFRNDPRAQLEFILSQVRKEEVEQSWHLYPVGRLVSGK
ncbi:MAG: M14 family zinc carboxypeptidase [Bacteroidales bacterium]